MPTRKQRRRREKGRRHEYEYVWVDDEGREVEVDPAEVGAAKTRSVDGKPARDRRGRPVRKIEPPSWSRVGKRALIFAPFMFVVVWLLKPEDAPAAGAVVQTLVLLGFFLPFSYLMDSMMYRAYLRRTGQTAESRRR
ncbi:MAG: hypothetical protein M3321_09925 [Actinomycetota bacterium]|nr:hypothetical protein [Actinomycetota bacterium]